MCRLKKVLRCKHAKKTVERDRNALYVVSAGGSFVEGSGPEERWVFFPALAAYVLTLHDAQTKVVDCRRTATSKDIGGGMGTQMGVTVTRP